MNSFVFDSTQSHTELIKGEMRTQMKKVHVKDGAGTVEVKYLNPKGKVLAKHAEQLTNEQIRRIMDKRFVPDLFDKCLVNCGSAAQEQTPRNAAKLQRLAGGGRTKKYAFASRRKTRRNN